MESASSDHVLRNLTGDRDDRHGIHEGIRQAGHEVGRTGSGSGHAEANFTRGAGITFGGKDPTLLVAREDRADLF